MFSLGCPNNNFQKIFELKIYFQFWFLGHPVTIEIFWVRQRLGFFYRNNFYFHNLTIKFIFGSKRNVFSWKRSIRVVRKSDFFIFLITFLTDELQKKSKYCWKGFLKNYKIQQVLQHLNYWQSHNFVQKNWCFCSYFDFLGHPNDQWQNKKSCGRKSTILKPSKKN